MNKNNKYNWPTGMKYIYIKIFNLLIIFKKISIKNIFFSEISKYFIFDVKFRQRFKNIIICCSELPVFSAMAKSYFIFSITSHTNRWIFMRITPIPFQSCTFSILTSRSLPWGPIILVLFLNEVTEV